MLTLTLLVWYSRLMEKLIFPNKEKHIEMVIEHDAGMVYYVKIRYTMPIPLYKFINCATIVGMGTGNCSSTKSAVPRYAGATPPDPSSHIPVPHKK